MAEVSGPRRKEIIENSPDLEKIKQKYQEQEERALEEVKKKYNESTKEGLIAAAKQHLFQKMERSHEDIQKHPGAGAALEPIKGKIITDPESDAVRNLKENLREELEKSQAIAKEHFGKTMPATGGETLSGRVKPGS